MNWPIVVLFLTGVGGFVGGFFTYISSRRHEETGCVLMVASSILAAAMIILGSCAATIGVYRCYYMEVGKFNMSAAQFFLYCFYALFGTIIFAVCAMIIMAMIIEVRKRWKASK